MVTFEQITHTCGHVEEWIPEPQGNFTVEALRQMWQHENCADCERKQKEQATLTTDERTVAEFELSDLGVDHAQYFTGVSTVYTDWDEVFVGVGDTAREAASDAIASASQVVGVPYPAMESALDDFDNERSAHAECEHNRICATLSGWSCDCGHDECELQHYAALYVRYE